MSASTERDPQDQPDQVRNADEAQHESWVNQQQHEPMPASRHAEGGGADVEDPASRHHNPAAGPDGAPEPASEETPADPPEGKAIRDMMGGPPPQGDVPDAPGVQVAATFDEDDRNGDGPKARYIANAVPGQPDGEVDTRS